MFSANQKRQYFLLHSLDEVITKTGLIQLSSRGKENYVTPTSCKGLRLGMSLLPEILRKGKHMIKELKFYRKHLNFGI